jgi:hypothetical protein
MVQILLLLCLTFHLLASVLIASRHFLMANSSTTETPRSELRNACPVVVTSQQWSVSLFLFLSSLTDQLYRLVALARLFKSYEAFRSAKGTGLTLSHQSATERVHIHLKPPSDLACPHSLRLDPIHLPDKLGLRIPFAALAWQPFVQHHEQPRELPASSVEEKTLLTPLTRPKPIESKFAFAESIESNVGQATNHRRRRLHHSSCLQASDHPKSRTQNQVNLAMETTSSARPVVFPDSSLTEITSEASAVIAPLATMMTTTMMMSAKSV